MVRRIRLVSALIIGALGICLCADWTQGEGEKKSADKIPEVAGAWTGDWGPYDPAKGMALEKEKCKKLDCTVVLKEGAAREAGTSAGGSAKVWEATFEGECGRPYKYTIKMEGRQASDVVLFKGTVDLGEKDGGVYDWVGRATDKEFAGFYTSSHHVGVFRLARVK